MEHPVQSVGRALDLFERLVRSDEPMGLRSLSEVTGLPVGTVHRLLGVLVARGYARQESGTRRYTVGTVAFDLAERLRQRGSLAEIARPYLHQLMELTGESANLAVLDGQEAVYLAHVAPHRMVRMFTEVGNRAPLYASGTGKVLLAFLPDEQRRALVAGLRLERFTQTTIVDPERLDAALAEIELNGYARDEGEYEEGVYCLALPVYDQSSRVVAAVSVSGPNGRLTPERAQSWLPRMQAIAAALSQALGYVGPG